VVATPWVPFIVEQSKTCHTVVFDDVIFIYIETVKGPARIGLCRDRLKPCSFRKIWLDRLKVISGGQTFLYRGRLLFLDELDADVFRL